MLAGFSFFKSDVTFKTFNLKIAYSINSFYMVSTVGLGKFVGGEWWGMLTQGLATR